MCLTPFPLYHYPSPPFSPPISPSLSLSLSLLTLPTALVDWMTEVCDDRRLTRQTVHLSVRVLDTFLAKISVRKSRLQLVSICSILIASKYEEIDTRVPFIDELLELANHAFTIECVHQMEVLILNQLRWSVSMVTPVHFVKNLLYRGMLTGSDTIKGLQPTKESFEYLVKFVYFFTDFSLQREFFYLIFILFPVSLLSLSLTLSLSPILPLSPLDLLILLSCLYSFSSLF